MVQLLVIRMNETILQFLDNLMGTFNRMCLAFKRCGFKSGSISFFFFFFFKSFFIILFVKDA